MSKAQMIMNSGNERIHSINVDYEETQIEYSANHLNYLKKMKGASSEKLDGFETEIVESLQSIFRTNKDNIRICSDIAQIHKQADSIALEPTISQ